jgi:pSer/pThr/pTyr-binding forkhead associated (FHA) protein
MALVTIQVIEGLERGAVYSDLPTPVTIGREDDNDIRLNDERVSRFHAKIQEVENQLILTDLDSTNGSRVNGHPVQIRVLRLGDQLSIGRCLLVFGSAEQIAEEISDRTAAARGDGPAALDSPDRTIPATGRMPVGEAAGDNPLHAQGPSSSRVGGSPQVLFPDGPPALPSGLGLAARAQLADFLAYSHEQIREVLLAAVQEAPDGDPPGAMRADWATWQRLLMLEKNLALSLRRIVDPDA